MSLPNNISKDVFDDIGYSSSMSSRDPIDLDESKPQTQIVEDGIRSVIKRKSVDLPKRAA